MLNYFTLEQAQQFTFYRLPKVLCTEKEFETLSTDAKLLYGLLLDRLTLSIKNNWVDLDNHAYVYYKAETVCNILHCSLRKAKGLFQELENIGLIKRKKQGFGKPSMIYVMSFTHDIEVKQEQSLKYDYYSLEDAKQFSFYRVPLLLFENLHFQSLSTDAKLLYGILLDRLQLSVRCQWVDEENHTYIYFKTEDAEKLLGCCEKKSRQLFIELEQAELIQRRKQGFGKPAAIYVMNFIEQAQDMVEPVNSAPMEKGQTGNICTYDENKNNGDIETMSKKTCNIKENNQSIVEENQKLQRQTGKYRTNAAVNSAPQRRYFLHHDTSKNCTNATVNSALHDRYFLHSNYTYFNHIDFSHTDCIQTEQQPKEKAVVDALRTFISEPLTDKELLFLYSTANGNTNLIKEKYALMQTQNVHNVMGFLLTAIKEDYQPYKSHTHMDYLLGIKEKLQRKICISELEKQYPHLVIKIDEFITTLTNIIGSKQDFPMIDDNLYFKQYAVRIAESLSLDFMQRLISTSFSKDISSIFMDSLNLCDCLIE